MKKQFLNLGKQPIANGFLYKDQIKDEYFYNLGVAFDEETKLVTQTEYVDPPLMFNDKYVYRGSMSQTMREHFKSLCETFSSNTKILEIGSNDGVFIKNLNPKFTVSVEPCSNFAKETQDMGYTTYPEFWTQELSNKILKNHGHNNYNELKDFIKDLGNKEIYKLQQIKDWLGY